MAQFDVYPNPSKTSKAHYQISFGDQALLLLTPQISSVPEKHLRNPIGSLSHVRDLIIGALDLAITGF